MLGFYFCVVGTSLLIASRRPSQAQALVWTVLDFELAGMLGDFYKLARWLWPEGTGCLACRSLRHHWDGAFLPGRCLIAHPTLPFWRWGMNKTSRACAAAALWRMRRAASICGLTPTATRPLEQWVLTSMRSWRLMTSSVGCADPSRSGLAPSVAPPTPFTPAAAASAALVSRIPSP
jgi:hypothetical protein